MLHLSVLTLSLAFGAVAALTLTEIIRRAWTVCESPVRCERRGAWRRRSLALAALTGLACGSMANAQIAYVYTVAGDGTYGYSGDLGPATLADVGGPRAAIFDKAGNLYIADTNNYRVRKVAAGTGIITTIAGTGVQGFSGDNGPATSAQISWNSSLAPDNAGNLYISDGGAQVVREVNLSTGVITTFAGQGNSSGFSGDGHAATSAQLDNPMGIAFDGAGNLYIVDSNNQRIREVAVSTGIITTVAGTGSAGYTGDGQLAINATFNSPWGIAVDGAGNLYIADANNNVVREVFIGTGKIATIAGNGTPGYSGDGSLATAAQLNQPTAVAVDGAGNVFITDMNNGVIREVAAGANIITTIAGSQPLACGGDGQDGGVASGVRFCQPAGIAVDASDNLYIADGSNARIRKLMWLSAPPTTTTPPPVFSPSGGDYAGPQWVTLSDPKPGAAIYYYPSINGSTANGYSPGFFGPINVSGDITISAIAIAPGSLPSAPVAASYTIASPPAAIIETVAGNGTYGYNGLGGLATNAEIANPQGMVVDAQGDYYFSDIGNNVVWMVDAQTGIITVVAGNHSKGYSGDGQLATSAQLNNPFGIALDAAGDLYIADQYNNVIREVNASTGIISTIAGTGKAGWGGTGGLATAAQLTNPTSVALDSAGNVYIADTSDHLVRKVTVATGIITTVAGNGGYYSGDGGPATSAGVPLPQGLAFDSAGNLYIFDGSNRIRKVAAGTGIISTVAGNGAWGYSGDGGPATSAELTSGEGTLLAVDAANNLYVGGTGTIVRMISASTGIITTVAGSGIWGSFGDGGPPTLAAVVRPAGLAFDKAGNLYIADSGNSRIREVVVAHPAPTPVFSLSTGSYINPQTVTITDSLAGATIYYSTNGEPTLDSPVYTGPVTIPSSSTLQAFAVAKGYTPSAVASAAYSIAPNAATPTFSVAPGVYPATQSVALADATAEAVIYYTTNGTAPTTSSAVYSKPIAVSSSTEIQAMAVAKGDSYSAVAIGGYVITPLAVKGAFNWTWMGGSSTPDQPGVYGKLGTAAAGNLPGGRDDPGTWADSSGNLWLWGGNGDDANGKNLDLNDMWEYSLSSKQWTWMGGSSVATCGANGCIVPGVWGTMGVAAAGNVPSGRATAVMFTDAGGNLWLFGGWGYDAEGNGGEELGDLWKLSATTKQWEWVGGKNVDPSWTGNPGVYGALGTPAAANIPGSRSDTTSWIDKSGNLWLYGGHGTASNGNWGTLNELWEFNASSSQWAWMGGSNTVPAWSGYPPVYGTLRTAAASNWPGGRQRAQRWTDNNGNFWLFGGGTYDTKGDFGYANDLWEFNPATGWWTWVGGSIPSDCGNAVCPTPGSYGTPGVPTPGNAPGGRTDAATWTDKAGNLWLFGGEGYDASGNLGYQNDLWVFNPSTRMWTWMGGSATLTNNNVAGSYGTRGTPAAANNPPGRYMAATWTDKSGNFWLLGGRNAASVAADQAGNLADLNDLWMFQPYSTVAPAVTTASLATSAASAVYGQSVTFTARVSSTAGAPPNGESVSFLNGTTPLGNGTLSSGTATFTTVTLPVGTYSVTAAYAGDTSFAGSASKAISQSVGKASSTTVLISSPNPSSFAELVTLTARVAGQFTGSPTGTVTFKSGSTTLGAAPLTAGSAAFPIAALPQGTDSVTAVYSGDSNFTTSTSNTVKQVVAAQITAGEDWTWISGGKTVLQVQYNLGGLPGVYGTLGIPAPQNTPGSRDSASNWIDPAGHLWLLGGLGYDAAGNNAILNDLWQFNPATDEWTWISGSSTACTATSCGVLGVYGKLGTPAAGNVPGSRENAFSWIDAAGNLWLFGGLGPSNNGTASLNDLWEFNPSTKLWTWVGGASTVAKGTNGHPGNSGVYGKLGTVAATNVPSGHWGGKSWTDAAGNFWLFGGYGIDSKGTWGTLNDLWELNPSTKQWTWMGGSSTIPGTAQGNPGVYGTLGKAASTNTPGSREWAISWTDKSGNLWLFGGYGLDGNNKWGQLDDLWEFVAASKQWAWIAGSKSGSYAGVAGVYGSIGKAASTNMPGSRLYGANWTDTSGNLWLFGGFGADSAGNLGNLGDLWKYTPSANQWTWIAGTSTVAKTTGDTGGPSGVYGILGVPAAGNIPGGREYSASWADKSGNLWLFGGNGIDSSGDYGLLNDLWRYQP